MKKTYKAAVVIAVIFAMVSALISCRAPEEAPVTDNLPQPSDNPVNITLSQSSISTDDSTGVSISGSTLTINAPGTYKISGELTNGQIIIDTLTKGDVFVVLSGAKIHCNSSSPIYCKQTKNLYIVLDAGTENFVSDGDNYVFEPGLDEPDATIFSKDDLFIMGEGALNVDANYNDGITGKDDVNIESGNITVDAINHGIKGKDSLEIKGGNVNVTANGDGLKSTQDNDATLGFVEIKGGNVNISAGDEGIQAYTQVIISGGNITIKSSDTAVKAEQSISVSGGTMSITTGDSAFSSVKVEGSAEANVTVNGKKYSF